MNNQQKILVYGATGAQGIPVVRRLLQEGYHVRALVRNSQKAEALQQAGAEITVGNLGDLASLEVANKGIDSVFMYLPLEFNSVVTEYGQNAIKAAKAAGVRHLVFNTSVLVPGFYTNVKALDLKRDVEMYLRESGLPYIILRPTFYMENFAAPWSAPTIMQERIVAYPMDSNFKAAWITLEDVAGFVVEALKNPQLSGSAFEIGGPEVLSGNEIAERFAAVLGNTVRYCPIPLDQFEQQMNAAMGKPIGTEIAALYRWFMSQPQSPAVIDTKPVLQKFPVQLTPLEQWIRRQNCFSVAKNQL